LQQLHNKANANQLSSEEQNLVKLSVRRLASIVRNIKAELSNLEGAGELAARLGA
jgi:hypothetical protein